MTRGAKTLVGVAALVVAATGYIAYSLRAPVVLPEPQRATRREVFPELDFKTAAPGTRVALVFSGFGKSLEQPENIGTRCISFVYDPDLFDGALVVRATGSTIERRWLVKGSSKPNECSGLPEFRVDLRGWYAAATR